MEIIIPSRTTRYMIDDKNYDTAKLGTLLPHGALRPGHQLVHIHYDVENSVTQRTKMGSVAIASNRIHRSRFAVERSFANKKSSYYNT